MKKQVILFLFMVLLGVSASTSSAHASEFDQALKRMDEIIAQMKELRAEFASLARTVQSVPTPTVSGVTSDSILGSDLRYGSTNEDIKKIQQLLATDPSIYPYGVASGFFGPKTRDAVRAFQARFDLDTVGVIGPATRSLLEVFFATYPDGNYPPDVLSKGKLTIAGISTSRTVTTTSSGGIKSIKVTQEDDEFIVKSYRSDGKRNRDMVLYPQSADELVSLISDKLSISESQVRTLIAVEDFEFETKKSTSRIDKGDADDAIEDADKAIDKARARIRDAKADGVDIDRADGYYDDARAEYRKAKTERTDEAYEESVQRAQKAESLANKAIDVLDGGGDTTVESIEVTVREDDAKVRVTFEGGDRKRFTVDETNEDDIVSAVAQELDIKEREVEEVIDVEYGDIKDIFVQVDANRSRVTVNFTSGLRLRFTVNEDEEIEIVRAISRKIHAGKNAVEKDIEFD